MEKKYLLLIIFISTSLSSLYSQCIPPTPFAGNDTTLCTSSVQLNANTPAAGNTGYWSTNSPFITINDINDPHTIIQTSQMESCYNLIWTEEVSPTCFSSDTVNICFLDGSSIPPPPLPTTFHCFDSTCFQTYHLPFPSCGSNGFCYNLNQLPVYSYLTGQNSLLDSLLVLYNACNSPGNSYDTTYIICIDSVSGSTVIITPDSITIDMVGNYTFQVVTEHINTSSLPCDTICDLLPCVCAGSCVHNEIYFHIHYDKPGISAFSIDPTCIDPCSGYALGNVSGGYPPYTVSMGTISSGNFSLASLCPGIYPVIVTDNLGCKDTTDILINPPPNPIITITQTNATCFNNLEGSASAQTLNGVAPYSYVWSNGNTTEDITGLSPGTYTVTVTDANYCTASQTVIIISEATYPTAGFTSSTNQCLEGNSFDFANTGDTGNGITWMWNFQNGNPSFSTDEHPDGISWNSSGQYTVTQTSTIGVCSDVSVYTIEVFDQPSISVSTTDITCNGLSNGSASAIIAGGSGNYTYDWNTPSASQIINNLNAGLYSVTVTDSNSCTSTASGIINEPLEVTSGISVISNITCNNNCDGEVDLEVSGGTPNYSFIWSNGKTIEDPVNLCAGNYSVTITDQNGCTSCSSVILSEPPAVTFHIDNINSPSCYGYCDGNIQISANGGTAPYDYVWSNSVLSSLNENLCAGFYQAIVTDANNCNANLIIELTQPDEIFVNITGNTQLCSGSNDTLFANVYGGNPPFSYFWNGIPSTKNIAVNPANDTTFSLSVIDSDGCLSSDTDIVHINVTHQVQLELSSNKDSVCPSDPVFITSKISYGLPPYIIIDEYGNVITTPFSIYPETDTVITLTVYDDCGFSSSDTLYIAVYDLPQINFAPDKANGCAPLKVNFNNSSEGVSFLWNFGDNDHANLSFANQTTHIYETEGIYSVTLTATSKEGCKNSETYNNLITVHPKPVAKFTLDKKIVSITKPHISFTNLSQYADTSLWIFGDDEYSNQINPKHTFPVFPSGTYNVTLIVTSNDGCKDTTSEDVVIKDEFTFYPPNAFTPDHDGVNDVFYVKGNGIDPTNYHLYIYDRWGEIIFETKNMHEGWDGRVKSGKIGKVGVYTWLVSFYTNEGIKKEEKGYITLIR